MKFAERTDLKCPHHTHTHTQKELCEVMDVLISLIVVICKKKYYRKTKKFNRTQPVSGKTRKLQAHPRGPKSEKQKYRMKEQKTIGMKLANK